MSQHNPICQLPIYRKAEQLYHLVESLAATLPESDDYIQATKQMIREDAMILPAKIAGAEGGDLYSIRMQNAAIIRQHAMSLYIAIGSLRFHESYKDLEYVAVIHSEVEAFRGLFIDWVADFDRSNYNWDEWELFNPPGAIPPSDSGEHFDSNDFLEDDE